MTSALLLVLVSACSPLGDDDDSDEPTATAAVPVGEAPTVETTESTPIATPVATPRVQPGPGTPRAGIAATRTPVPDDDADLESTPVADEESTEEPVEATPDADEGDAEPTEEDEPEPTRVVVDSCEEPDELPERTGRQNRVVAEDALRLRDGPGTTCDEITSLAVETPVRVISGVVESEDDEIEWVKVEVDDTEGWVAVEFLENPPAD